MLDEETILFLLALAVAFIVFVIVLNPYFWQGFRNAKFIDELKNEKINNSQKEINEKQRQRQNFQTVFFYSEILFPAFRIVIKPDEQKNQNRRRKCQIPIIKKSFEKNSKQIVFI